MKTVSITLQKDNLWENLQDIFLKFTKFDRKTQTKLKKLEKNGVKFIYGDSNHPKLYFNLDKTYIVTISSTPSDNYAGQMILRQIRRIYEQYDTEHHLI